jgi:hypothetical protein
MLNQNPVDFLIQQFGMTRLDMTVKYGFGANHLLLAAQGRKDSLGPTLLSAFDIEATERGLSVDRLIEEKYGQPDLAQAWEQWRVDQRAEVDLGEIPLQPEGLSPWERVIEQYGSVAKIARTLRVRDLVVSRYTATPTMPTALREALEGTGWGQVDNLERTHRAYFDAA